MKAGVSQFVRLKLNHDRKKKVGKTDVDTAMLQYLLPLVCLDEC